MSATSQRQHPIPLQVPEIAIHFVSRIENSYPKERNLFVTTFCNRFIERIDLFIQKQSHTQINDNNNNDQKSRTTKKEQNRFCTDDDIYDFIKHETLDTVLCLFFPYIIHQRFMCPFNEIQESFSKLIQQISKKLHVQISHLAPPYPLSGFLDLSAIKLPYECKLQSQSQSQTITNGSISPTNDDNHKQSLHEQLYSMFGRINNLHLVLSQHHEYLTEFISLFHSLMYENNGPLALDKRQYLALMACSRYSCQPLILNAEFEYKKFNGDITWIKSGITSAPIKYQKLCKINAILAHQPWLIKPQHIAELVNDAQWTISEIVQSFIILITFHFLCGMYQGICITPEIDEYYALMLLEKHQKKSTATASSSPPINGANEINNILSPLMQTMTISSSMSKSPLVTEIDTNNITLNNDDELKATATAPTAATADAITMHTAENNLVILEDDEEESKMEEQSCQNIVKLLSHTQQQILEDENVVGVAKKGFEQAASLNMDLDTVSDANVANNSGSCLIKFRQLSGDSVDDDSFSMDFDPNMAPPPSLSNHSQNENENEDANDMDTATTSTQTQTNAVTKDVIESKTDVIDEDKDKNTKKKLHELTASNWKQLISLRQRNMLPITSDPSIKMNTVSLSTSNGMNTNMNIIPITNFKPINEINNNEKLAKITKPHKKGGSSHSHKKIIAPSCQGISYWKYSSGLDMKYIDFDCHSQSVIHCYDFNWEKHGYACLSRYYPGIEKKMDAVFRKTKTMTDFSINNKGNLNTEPFRIAIWHYTFRLYGVNNDSYDYRNVNVYLPVKLKIFIKKLVCYSQIVTIDDIKRMGVKLKEKEKIHVAILALEAKKQASLLFALRAVMHYMQSPTNQ